MDNELHAWVDESTYFSHPKHGFYVLASAIAKAGDCRHIRQHLRNLVRSSWDRLHWHEEEKQDRDNICETISKLPVDHLAVTSISDQKRQERARRKCLERLLFELHGRGVSQVWLESRQTALNRKDQQMVSTLVINGTIPRSFEVNMAKPLDEPMLWIPDATAGMTSFSLRTGDTEWLTKLADSYTQIML